MNKNRGSRIADERPRPLWLGKRYKTKLRETIQIEEFVTAEDGSEKVRYSFLTGANKGREFMATEQSLAKRIKGKHLK